MLGIVGKEYNNIHKGLETVLGICKCYTNIGYYYFFYALELWNP